MLTEPALDAILQDVLGFPKDLWYAVRGRTPWHVRRDYEPRPMASIPYRRPEGDPRSEEVAHLVRRMATDRRALLPHRALFPGLRRTVRSPWDDRLPEPGMAVAVALLPADRALSVRLHPALTATVGDAPHGRVHRDGPERITLRRARVQTGAIAGPEPFLDVLEATLPTTADPLTARVPLDAAECAALVRERRNEVQALLAEGRAIVERIERLVCALYGVPDALTDEIVANAVARAGAVGADPANG